MIGYGYVDRSISGLASGNSVAFWGTYVKKIGFVSYPETKVDSL